MTSGVYPRKSLEERFWEKVDIRGPDDCWPWVSALYRRGTDCYGAFWYRGGNIGAHRMALFLSGELEDPRESGEFVTRHQCIANKLCCNPRHLLPGTASDNNRDAVRQGRARVGERHHRCKLTAEQVADIRIRYVLGGVTQTELAAAYGMAVSQINRIILRKSRNHDGARRTVFRVRKRREP